MLNVLHLGIPEARRNPLDCSCGPTTPITSNVLAELRHRPNREALPNKSPLMILDIQAEIYEPDADFKVWNDECLNTFTKDFIATSMSNVKAPIATSCSRYMHRATWNHGKR